jgi:hypothetical protein
VPFRVRTGGVLRTFGFYGLLGLPIIAWVVGVILFNVNYSALSSLLFTIVTVSPIVAGDISLVGEITPIALALSLIALAPTSRREINIVPIATALLIYVLYLHLTVFFSSPPGRALIRNKWSGDQAVESTKIVLTLLSNIRIAAVVIAASLIGFRIKNGKSEPKSTD